VELVCVDSAAEALDRFERGEHFDVALVDTVMPGMDGWTLLARLREMDATARLPIALMAGVLDPVDPARLAKAPIQGFLKKPIELRELGDRVRALLASPVAAADEPPAAVIAAPAAPVAAPAMDLARTAEMPMPEFRPDVPSIGDSEVLPPLDLGPDLDLPEPGSTGSDEDLLLLTAEDLWPEDVPAEAAPVALPTAAPDVHLELEELDLESLHGLTSEAAPSEPPPVHPVLAAPPDLPPVEAAAPEAEALAAESLASFTDLESFEDLGGSLDLPPLPEPPPAEAPTILPVAGLAAAGLAAAAIPMLERHQETPPAPVVELPVIPVPAPAAEHLEAAPAESPAESRMEAPAAPAPAASGQAVAALGQVPLTPDQVQALLADPALMDALVKAVVARMGDQVVREIAWEVMPDLAGRLQR
jgi:CheY-like chemotaxis protein